MSELIEQAETTFNKLKNGCNKTLVDFYNQITVELKWKQ